jgi:N-acetylneuraminic acid mutarotase
MFLNVAIQIALFSTVLATAPPAKCWDDLSPLQVGERQEHGVALGENGTIYAIGGLLRRAVSASVEEYNIAKNEWREVADLPTAMHHPNVASVNGKVYVLGGVVGLYPWEPVGDSFVYEPRNNSWTKIKSLIRPRGSAVVGVHEGKVWLAGGLDGIMQAMNSLDMYDTVTDEWTTFPDLQLPWPPRDHAGGGVINDTFYVIGGRIGQIEARLNDTLALNVRELPMFGWTEKAQIPTGRGGAAVAIMGKKIYVFGGEGNAADPTGVYGDMDVYDSESNKWSSEGKMKYPVHGTGAVAVGDKIYVPAGSLRVSMGQPARIMESYGPGPCSEHVAAP